MKRPDHPAVDALALAVRLAPDGFAHELYRVVDSYVSSLRRDFGRAHPLTHWLHHALRCRALSGATECEPLPDAGGGRDTRTMTLLLTYGEVAEALAISKPQVRHLVSAGVLPVRYINSAPRIHRDDLESYVDGLPMERAS